MLAHQELKGCLASIAKTCYPPGVYEPSEDTFALADALLQDHQLLASAGITTVLEIGPGSGYVLCSALLLLEKLGRRPLHALGLDISEAAAAAASATLRQHGRSADIIVTDATLAEGLLSRLASSVGLILFNPPYVPTPDSELEGGPSSLARAWAGGDRGRRVIDRVVPVAAALLAPGGLFYMVTVHENDPQGLIAELTDRYGWRGEVALRRVADEEVLTILRFSKS